MTIGILCQYQSNFHLSMSQLSIDGVQTNVTTLNWDISKINIHRITWHIFMKQIDGSPTMHGKIFYSIHRGHDTYEQCHLLFISILHNRSMLLELLFCIWHYTHHLEQVVT